MKKFAAYVFLVVILSLSACTKAMRYSAEEIKDFSPAVQEHIKKGEITLGMTMVQVRYAWGGPDSTSFMTPAEDGKERVEWTYQKTPLFKTRLIFSGEVLTGIISSEPGSVK